MRLAFCLSGVVRAGMGRCIDFARILVIFALSAVGLTGVCVTKINPPALPRYAMPELGLVFCGLLHMRAMPVCHNGAIHGLHRENG
jgi:hypothetical protein